MSLNSEKMMTIFISLFAGLLFGIGLIVSGMANPGKVLGFLDLTGNWDPSLAFVMGGAITVGLISFAIIKRRSVSFLGHRLLIPIRRDIDRRLVIGSGLFGIGWGIAGFCPGPALVSLGTANPKAVFFVLSMLAGMGIFEILELRKRTR